MATNATQTSWWSSATRAVRRPAVLTVVGTLCLAAVGLNAAVVVLDQYFQKKPVPLRAELTTIPTALGPWVQVTLDEPMSAEVEHALGTDKHLTRSYVDTRKAPPALVAELHGKEQDERRALLARIEAGDPSSVMTVHMAYYTGAPDTVAHIPERCMTGGGFVPTDPRTVTLPDVPAFGKSGADLPVKYVEFTEQGARATTGATAGRKLNFAYFFQVNGQYDENALSGVQAKLQDLRNEYGYYCKIELRAQHGEHADQARAAFADFLRHALPQIERCLPDWEQVKAGNANPAAATTTN